MATSISQLEYVLSLARQLTPADQAKLVAHLAPTIATAGNAETRGPSHALPPNSRAAQLAADPQSALAQVLSIVDSGHQPPTDSDIAGWREERLSERYGV
jgi:hypothetical protein